MKERDTSIFENGLIWFGAAVSIAEILTGMYFAPLGFSKGLLAILVGHVIGCAMLFFAGLIGGKVRKSAMETVNPILPKSWSRQVSAWQGSSSSSFPPSPPPSSMPIPQAFPVNPSLSKLAASGSPLPLRSSVHWGLFSCPLGTSPTSSTSSARCLRP